MTYSELLQKVLSGDATCHDGLLSCDDCPYVSYGQNIDSQSHRMFCQQALLHDKNILINIMKYLDKIQEEVKENG